MFRNLTAALEAMIVIIRTDKCCDTQIVNMTVKSLISMLLQKRVAILWLSSN